MRVLRSNETVLDIQKCLLPDSDYLKQNYGKFVSVPVPGTSFRLITKLGLCPHIGLKTSYVDNSVLVLPSNWNGQILRKNVDTLNVGCLKNLPAAESAKRVKIALVFSEVTDIKKFKLKLDLLKSFIRDILRLYVFCNNSVIFLKNLPKNQIINLHCFVINHVIDRNNQSNSVGVYKLSSSTEIVIDKYVSQLKFELQGFNQNRYLNIYKKVYEILKGKIESSNCSNEAIRQTKNILLTGSTGSGKTSLVHQITEDCEAILFEVVSSDLNTSAPGEIEKKLKFIFDKAKSHGENDEKCVILIDEIDVICMRTKDNSSSHSKRTIQQLRLLIKDIRNIPGVCVFATTNCPEELDGQLRRPGYFDDEIEIHIPSEEEREAILHQMLILHKLNCSDDVLKSIAVWTPGFVIADLQLVVQEVVTVFHKMKDCNLEDLFKRAVCKIVPSSMKGAIGLSRSKDTSFSQIGGLDKVKSALNCSITQQLLHPERFKRLGIPQTKGVLLYGPPGCAKTSLVKALAKETHMTFIAVSAADLYSPFVGDAEQNIVKLFSQARVGAPSIIFIDEIDALVGSKSGGRERGVQERVLSALLVEMDGVGLHVQTHSSKENLEDKNGVIVVGATNRPDMIDPALLRPGRLDKLLHVHAPDESARAEILRKVTESMPLHESVDLEDIARRTNYYSGADLKNLCVESGVRALTCCGMYPDFILPEHFHYVLEKSRPSLNKTMTDFYENFKVK